MVLGANTNTDSSLLDSFRSILDLENSALRGPSGYIIIVQIAELKDN